MAVLITLRYLRDGIPFNLGWWGFTFPLGVYALATLKLASHLDLMFFSVFGCALVALLARREAGSREAALQQQADLLAALGSPSVHDDRALLLHQAEQAYDRAFNPEGVQRQLLAILAESSRVELLNRLTVPTLVVHGTADPLLPVMHGVHVAAHIKGSELKLIPGLAHRFQEAFKEPLLAAVLPYLQAHREDTSHWAQIEPVVGGNLL